ncbi:MAG TPA: HAMP domain-containing sensor histidine kinase [Parvibaculum sp.]
MTGQSDDRDSGVTPELRALAAAMFYIMAIFGSTATVLELLYAGRSGTLDRFMSVSGVLIMIPLFAIVFVMRRLPSHTFIRIAGLAIFYLESPLLLSSVAYNLFLSSLPWSALHNAVWLLVTFICAVALRPRRWAQIYGWCVYAIEVAIFLSWLAWRHVDPTIDNFAVAFFELLLCQASSLVLLLVLSAYRERDAFNRARIATLEETSEEMECIAGEARESQRRAEIARNHADQATRARDRFFATMSHELRTPLNAIIGFSDILAQELFGPHAQPRYREYAADIKSSGDHLLGVINHLLDFARFEAGEVSLNIERVDLVEVVGKVVRILRVNADRVGVQLRFEPPPGEGRWVHVDEQAVRQIAFNLVSNAIKFTPSGGSVEVAIGRAAGGCCELTVKDTGIGIPAAKLDEVFEPFRRVVSEETKSVPGTGLGLAIVKSLVGALGGTVSVESEPGRGSTFTVTLPSAPDEIASDSAVA